MRSTVRWKTNLVVFVCSDFWGAFVSTDLFITFTCCLGFVPKIQKMCYMHKFQQKMNQPLPQSPYCWPILLLFTGFYYPSFTTVLTVKRDVLQCEKTTIMKCREVNRPQTWIITRTADGIVLWRGASRCWCGTRLSLNISRSATIFFCWALWRPCDCRRCAAWGRCFWSCPRVRLLFLVFSPIRASGAISTGYTSPGPCCPCTINHWCGSCCCRLYFWCCTPISCFLHILCLRWGTVSWFVSSSNSIRLHGWCWKWCFVFRHSFGPIYSWTLRGSWKAFCIFWLQKKEK